MEKKKTSWDFSKEQNNAEKLNVVNQVKGHMARIYHGDGAVGVEGKILYIDKQKEVYLIYIAANLGFIVTRENEEEKIDKIKIDSTIVLRLDEITKIGFIF